MKTEPNEYTVHRDWSWGYPLITRTEGIYLYDTDRRKYIDGSGGSSVVVTIGHGVKEIAEAMHKQADKFSFYPAHVFSNEQALELGKIISDNAPGEMRNNCKTWLTCTGTDATDDAVRLARQHFIEKGQPSKFIVISRWQAFHGNSISAAGYSGHSFRRKIFLPMFNDSPHIPPAFCYRCDYDSIYPKCNLKCAKALESMICQYSPENVAAFIAEPVVGASLGAVPAPEGYFKEVRKICNKYNIIFIADEVMTGWGRTGKMFAIEHWDVTPDIIACAKGMTSGYTPLAAIMAKKEIWKPLEDNESPFIAGHTLNANAVSCAGAIAVINYLIKNKLVEKCAETGKYFLKRLEELLDSPLIGDVRGKGLMLGFEIVKDKKTKEAFTAKQKLSKKFQDEAFKRGLIVYSCTGSVNGASGDMILIAPPLIIEKNQVDEIINILKESIKALEK